MRHNFDRWFKGMSPLLSDPPRYVADRFLGRRKRIQALVPPRVCAAAFSTGWNRWCAARRWQRRDQPCNVCLLGCGGNAEDSVEHYARCQVVLKFHRHMLRIRNFPLLEAWLGTQSGNVSDAELALGAIGAYATYVSTNKARHMGRISPNKALRALQQAAREAVSGHERAMTLLDNVWSSG